MTKVNKNNYVKQLIPLMNIFYLPENTTIKCAQTITNSTNIPYSVRLLISHEHYCPDMRDIYVDLM